MTLKERAKKLKTDVPAVFLALKQPETPWYAKVMAALTVAYALSPIDLVPDFIPVLGYLDDLLLLPAMIALSVKWIPLEVFRRCQAEAEELWADGKPTRWYYAVPILLIWAVLIALIVWAIFF